MMAPLMGRFLTIASTAMLFGAVGPGIGALVVFAYRGAIEARAVPLAYVFGILPALVAGAIFGAARFRARGVPFPWQARALRGAGAGLAGCLLFILVGSTYTLVTAEMSTLRGELSFYGVMLVAGVLAGVVCALLMGRWWRRA
jgi:hypothetical protein